MAIAESVQNAKNILKVLYPEGISTPLYRASKAAGSMKKDNTFFGEGTKYVVVSIAPGAGGSANFQSAIANQSSTQEVRFSLGRKKLYEIGSIDGEFFASAKDKGAIVDGVKHTMGRSKDAFARTEARAIWNNGGGARGQISAGSNVATPTITLQTRDAAGFFKGMVLQLSTDDGTGGAGVLGSGATVAIASLTRETSTGTTTITATTNWNQIPGAAAGNYIFRAGDYGIYPNGIPGWAPAVDPINTDNFLGVNRFTAGDLNYLSGYRINGNGQAKVQTLIDAGAEAALNGLNVNTVYMNPLDMRDAFKEQSTYKSIQVDTDNVKVGYKGIELETAIGSVTVLAETDVPKGQAWLIDPSTWTRRSAGDVPMLLNFDGVGPFLRNPVDDSYQYRLGGYVNYENSEPNQAVIITF